MNLIFAFLPAAMLGPFLDEIIESLLFGLLPIAFALFTGAILCTGLKNEKKHGIQRTQIKFLKV